jgi:predicted permease
MDFTTTAIAVITMLIYALPGYLAIKTKAVKEDSIAAFAKLLLFVFQPCLSLYSFNKATYTPLLLKNMGIVFAVSIGVQVLLILFLWLIFKKHFDDVRYRIASAAAVFGNVGFFGVPLLEKLLPDCPDALAYSAVFIISLNLLAWTLGSFVLTKDKKYFSFKKIVLNPPILTLVIALPLFFTGTKLPVQIDEIVSLLGKMTTPICMIILGMRLATVSAKELFGDWRCYLSSAVKLVILPLFTLALIKFLPFGAEVKTAIFILSCCPSATVVLNLSEMYAKGQKSAANCVLLSTIFCVLTIPLLLLLI